MRTELSQHTITIEPHTDTRGICELAVVDRVNGAICLICCLEHEVGPGVTLTAVALVYARMFDAVYLPESSAQGGVR